MDHVFSESCYKGTVLQWNHISFLKFQCKIVVSHKMMLLYPSP